MKNKTCPAKQQCEEYKRALSDIQQDIESALKMHNDHDDEWCYVESEDWEGNIHIMLSCRCGISDMENALETIERMKIEEKLK